MIYNRRCNKVVIRKFLSSVFLMEEEGYGKINLHQPPRSRYTSSHLQNYTQYISTREGAEKVDESKKNLPVTMAQKKLIKQLLKDIPDAKNLLEYEVYHQHAAIGTPPNLLPKHWSRS